MVEDVRELSEHLIRRLGKKKIFVLGHSWGSMMGIPLVQRYPELFHAYIGTGQVISVHENEVVGYRKALEVARERNITEAIEALEDIAPYPHPETGTLDTRDVLRYWQRELGLSLAGKQQWWLEMLEAGLASPDYSLLDLNLVFNVPREHQLTKIPEMASMIDRFDLWQHDLEFQVPIVFLLGRLDWQVPSVIAARYFDAAAAPYKKLVWFERSAHSPPTEEKGRFVQVLVSEVLPLAGGTDGDRRSGPAKE
jgi:pimeloyl-ACP methyl ester carboxylesterase